MIYYKLQMPRECFAFTKGVGVVTGGLSVCLNSRPEEHSGPAHEQPVNGGWSLNPGLLLQAGQCNWEYLFFPFCFNVNLSERKCGSG